MQHLVFFPRACSSAAARASSGTLSRPSVGATAVVPSSPIWTNSRRCVASSSTLAPSSTLSKNGRRKAKRAEKVLVKSKGKLELSDSYLEDFGQPSRPAFIDKALPRSDPAVSTSKSASQKSKAKRSSDGKTAKERPCGPPAEDLIHAAPALELRDFLEAKKVEDRERRLKKLERDALTGKRNRWAWEWFEEGKELGDIGERIASLPRYASEKPYVPATVAEWIIEHLRTTPATQEPVASDANDEDASPSTIIPSQPRTHSLDRLTPELWTRLSAPHPFWSTRPFEQSIGAMLEREVQADKGIWDLLWSRGWRGEGLEHDAAAGSGSAAAGRDGPLPISEDVLSRFLQVDERPAAERELVLGQQPVANPADEFARLPESARLAMALERLKLAKGEDAAKAVVNRITTRRPAVGN